MFPLFVLYILAIVCNALSVTFTWIFAAEFGDKTSNPTLAVAAAIISTIGIVAITGGCFCALGAGCEAVDLTKEMARSSNEAAQACGIGCCLIAGTIVGLGCGLFQVVSAILMAVSAAESEASNVKGFAGFISAWNFLTAFLSCLTLVVCVKKENNETANKTANETAD